MFYDSELSGQKERHCDRIISRYGGQSGRMNNSAAPSRSNWRTRDIDEPGFFSSDLYIRKEQTTSDGQYHLATCHWDKVGGFTFYLYDWRYDGTVIMCYDFGSSGDGTAC
jgi:hypothetical protein